MSDAAVSAHEAFGHLRSRRIETLGLTMHEYEHRATGAMHFHMEAPNAENVFMVAFRTVPMDSTGVAHILEHTALCGSERYPVRDPFFWMIRRSLNTFMNAFTTNDYTAYPFASLNRKDYFNLLDVYLDSVFFSRLEELDFAQEGYRVEFETPDDPSTPLVYRGVVYNEMKGDTSSPLSVLFDAMNAHLYPTTTYHYNSGGDPLTIPQLSYEQLLAFYRTHYHPGNAIFMTYGDIPAEEQQAVIHERALNRFGQLDARIEVGREHRFDAPRSTEIRYAVDSQEDLARNTHVVVGWLLGDNTDLDLLLRLNLLSDALLDTAASPLRQALESSPLAESLSPLCGLEETSREMSFVVGVEGSEADHAAAIEALILDTLERVAEEGIPQSQLEACLHQLELSQREIGGDGSPFGLQLIFGCMSAAIHRGDPIDLLDLDPALERLRQDIRQPGFIQTLIREQLLDNPHRVRLTMAPDCHLGEEKARQEREQLDAVQRQLDDDARQRIVDRAAALAARQSAEDDVSILPRVTIDDVGEVRQYPEPVRTASAGTVPLVMFGAATNGLTYHQVATQLPGLDDSLLQTVPLFSSLLTEIGSGGEGYLSTQQRQHAITGGINAYAGFRGTRNEPDRLAAWFTLSSRTLNPNAPAMASLVKRTLEAPNFSERSRLRELVSQTTLRRLNGLTNNAHGLAMTAAAAGFRKVPRLQFNVSGLAGISRLKQLNRALEDDAEMDAFIARLQTLAAAFSDAPKQLFLAADPVYLDDIGNVVTGLWDSFEAESIASTDFPVGDVPPAQQAWIINTQVNFCAQAHPTVPETHADSAPLSVLAGVLRNAFLHGELREKGGAYGGGASHESSSGVFRLYSYRDPNIERTFDIFDQARDWADSGRLNAELVEEAVLGLIAGLDAPSSPAGEAKQAFQSALFGRTAADRAEIRQRVLGVSVDDVRRVALDYLGGESTRAVVTNETAGRTLPADFHIFRV